MLNYHVTYLRLSRGDGCLFWGISELRGVDVAAIGASAPVKESAANAGCAAFSVIPPLLLALPDERGHYH